jgi:immunoglobulin-like protein involved in spore germination/sporulation and spore germination protein
MKRLPILMIVGVSLLAVGCGTPSSGSLGPAPTTTAGASSPASAPAGGTASGTANAAASPSGQRPTATPAPARQIGVQTWFSRNGKLFVTQRSVPVTAGVGRGALDRLLTGPSAAENAAGLRSQIPAGTTLRGLRISAGVATADLSSSFESAASPSAMPLRIAQVVYTLTQFPTVTGVRFAIDGQGKTVVGGVPVQSPQTRAMYGGYLPAITVQSPVIGAQVGNPVTVSGTADVFEATVSVRILNSAGHEIARTFTTASCGTGCRGGYSVTIPYSVPRAQPGTIVVFESSAKDGQPVNVQQIPVTLTP